MASKPNKGRSANAADREYARVLVKWYRLAEQSEDQRHCINPSAPYEERTFIYADDPELLLLALECFAASGKFTAKDTLGIEGFALRSEIAQLRKSGNASHGGAVQAIADRRNLDKRKVERLIRVNDKK